MKINLLDIPVFYINTKNAEEKDKKTRAMLEGLGFKDINRFEGVDIKEPKVGCAVSHNLLLEKILDVEYPVLILEDDVDISQFNAEIEVPDNSDAVYLGLSKYGIYLNSPNQNIVSKTKYDIIDKNICKLYNMLSAHAVILISKKYKHSIYNDIKKQIEIKDNQDKARARSMSRFNVYALRNPIFYQSGYNEYCTKIYF